MIKKIETQNGVITFTEKDFSNLRPIDIVKSTKNLLAVKKVLDEKKVNFGLMFGTLLGAVRENNFISHDEDVDLFVLEEDKESLLDCLHDLMNLEFKVCRYDGVLLSILRDDEYIDFYFFRKHLLIYRKCFSGVVYMRKYLENTKEHLFLGENFRIPKDEYKFLKVLYGKNWRKSIKNDNAISHSRYYFIRELIKKKIPFLFKIFRAIKKRTSW